MSKNQKILLAVAVLAVAGYFGWRWWQARQAAQQGGSPTGAFGTNLNSVAPELVGGSAGPSVGPALSAPVNITLNETSAPAPVSDMGTPMVAVNTPQSTNPLAMQNDAASQASDQSATTGAMQDTLGGDLGGGDQ